MSLLKFANDGSLATGKAKTSTRRTLLLGGIFCLGVYCGENAFLAFSKLLVIVPASSGIVRNEKSIGKTFDPYDRAFSNENVHVVNNTSLSQTDENQQVKQDLVHNSSLDLTERLVHSTSTSSQHDELDIQAFHNATLGRLRELINSRTILKWRTRNDFLYFFNKWHDPKLLRIKSPKEMWEDSNAAIFRAFGLAEATKMFAEFGNSTKDHVMLTKLYENYGAASPSVPERNAFSFYERDLVEEWNKNNVTVNDVMSYLNNEHTKAVFVTSHQFTDHPKLHSIPIGISGPPDVLIDALNDSKNDSLSIQKPQLLLLNVGTKQVAWREKLVSVIIDKFNGTVENTYGQISQGDFWAEIRRSKYVLCPNGFGWDTYRAWETLSLGSFPIIERFNRTDGFFRVFDDLPVLFVDNMLTDVTMELLEKAYPKLASTKESYKFEKLTRNYWYELVNSFRPVH